MGRRRRQGSIIKACSTHARRLLVEAAWHYRRAPRVSLTLKRRQAGQSPAAIDPRGARSTVAVARELACFVWEIARQPD